MGCVCVRMEVWICLRLCTCASDRGTQVKAPMMGRISKLMAAVGKAVKKGEILVVRFAPTIPELILRSE